MMLSVSPGLDRRLLLLQVADVLVVQVDVDEAAQLALVVVEVLLAARRDCVRQVGEQLADRRAVDLDGVLLVGERPQRSRESGIVLAMVSSSFVERRAIVLAGRHDASCRSGVAAPCTDDDDVREDGHA